MTKSPVLMGLKCLQILFILWNIHYCFGDVIVTKCHEACNRQVDIEEDDLFCSRECKHFQCKSGCSSYFTAVNSSCQAVCGKDGLSRTRNLQQTERQFCTQGCSFALNVYTEQIKGSLAELPAPGLRYKGASFLTLHWSGPMSDNVTFFIQSRVLDTNGDWFNYGTVLPNNDINITELQPFMNYTFRISIVITSKEVLYSPESEIMTTLPYGVPSSSPTILEVTAPTSSVIALSWRPPVYTNGPLLGYHLYLKPISNANVVSFEVSPNVTSWTFRQLNSSQDYYIRVAARNQYGEGQADSINMTTPESDQVLKEDVHLILAENNLIIRQDLTEVWAQRETILKMVDSNNHIKGLGLHLQKGIIICSDSRNQVHMITMADKEMTKNIYPSLSHPGVLTIDWLHNYTYIVDGLMIKRCDVDRPSCILATRILTLTPDVIQIDPINGFLFFNQGDEGLYAIDTGDITLSKPAKHFLVLSYKISAFSIDLNNMLLYFPNVTANSIMASFLDGTRIVDLRAGHVKGPNYRGIKSMAFHNGRFFFTDGTKLLFEEFNSNDRKFYLTGFRYGSNCSLFNMDQRTAQPYPVPHGSPQNVRGLFSDRRVIVQWKHPKTLSYQGKGAFKGWYYEINIYTEDNTGHEVSEKVTGSFYERTDLVPDTTYFIRVRAWSQSGFGPWSEVFLGRTLSKEASTAKVIVAATQSLFTTTLYEMDMEGKNRTELTTISSLGEELVDLSWTDKNILWVSDANKVQMYDRVSGDSVGIFHIPLATSVAYDWLGKKLYWSNPKENVIRRSDINGDNSEFIIQGTARHMSIDALQGRLYWVTSNTMEAAYLNGEDHIVYFSEPFFSGKHVISLTLNFDLRKVLWYVKSFERQELFISDLLGNGITKDQLTVQPLGSFHSISPFSVMQYFSHRLFWQNEKGSIVVGDLECNYTSEITTDPVSVFTVAHPSLHPYPEGIDPSKLQIIPSKVSAASIRCEGHWTTFNLTWEKARVNHGNIFYEVSIQIHRNQTKSFAMQTTRNHIEMRNITAYTVLTVTLRAYTYWGYGPVTIATIHSPMSIPSPPMTPRVYISQHKESLTSENSLAADFRWTMPENPNGIILEFVVYSWRNGDENNMNITTLASTARHFNLPCLKPGMTYYFQVAACTSVGCGKESVVVSAEADVVNPVPKLLVVSSHQLMIEEIDSVGNRSVLLEHIPPPITVTYLAQDNRMFWVDRSNVLLESCKNDEKQLLQLNGPVTDIAVDWISRTLYLAETNLQQAKSSIVAYLLDQNINRILVTREGLINSVVSDPLTSTIIWTEQENRTMPFKLFKMGPDLTISGLSDQGKNKKKRSAPSCNCNILPGSKLALDHSQDLRTEVLIYDTMSESIIATDMEGCQCRQIVEKEDKNNQGLPPDHLAVDHTNIYWYSHAENQLYILDKQTGAITTKALSDVNDMVAYGAHLQPLPSSECLYPNPYKGPVIIQELTNQTMTLQLEPVQWPSACDGISRPDTKFTVYYRQGTEPCGTAGSGCQFESSYNNTIVISRLQPYTDYTVHGAVSNYYTEYLAEALSQSQVYRTKTGVPYKAVIDSVTKMSPEEVVVTWFPPAVANGPEDELIYVIQYSTQTRKGYSQKQLQVNVTDKDCEVYLSHLEPNHLYKIEVLTSNAERKIFNISEPMSVKTYEKPKDVILISAGEHNLSVSWTSPSDHSVYLHKFKMKKCPYSQFGWEEKGDVLGQTAANMTYNVTFYDLTPYTDYCFQMVLLYDSKGYYVWTGGERFIFRTLSSIPETPEPPKVEPLSSQSGYEVKWIEPEDNGAVIFSYILQYWDVQHQSWYEVFNGSETHWVVDDIIVPRGSEYVFRVAAENSNGIGPFSYNSTAFTFIKLPLTAEKDDMVTIVTVVICSFVLCLIIVLICVCYVSRRRNRKNRKPNKIIIRGPDTELAVLRELPLHSTQESNTIYAINIVPTDSEIAKLPHFRRDQLMLTKFLGSGAFGEVFEGLAKNILGDRSGDTKVAVKTLRKSASDHEKEEFLKEAVLMSNFHHDHILSLLGVCLDNDPEFIILELMEGGDLLSYLRTCRGASTSTTVLCLTDLVKICVHVARGCKYLEDMHFVHRDLAARNCLVSSRTPSEIVVKIGDFGLARDIYKNDYYRKEGEGLLPVRWMSPESLVDGVFTTQSDIWAFGVLMWEVLTYGHQPYQARTNIEVLHFVRSGGKLEQPENCPEELFVLMNGCWSYTQEDRPNFSYILQQLEQFHEKCVTLLADYIMPVRTRPIEVDGCQDNTSIHSTRTNQRTTSSPGHDNDEETSIRATSFGSPEPFDTSDYLHPSSIGTPLYLELLHDKSSLTSSQSNYSRQNSFKDDAYSQQNERFSRQNSHNSETSVQTASQNGEPSRRKTSQNSEISEHLISRNGSRHSSCSSDIYSRVPFSGYSIINVPEDIPMHPGKQIHPSYACQNPLNQQQQFEEILLNYDHVVPLNQIRTTENTNSDNHLYNNQVDHNHITHDQNLDQSNHESPVFYESDQSSSLASSISSDHSSNHDPNHNRIKHNHYQNHDGVTLNQKNQNDIQIHATTSQNDLKNHANHTNVHYQNGINGVKPNHVRAKLPKCVKMSAKKVNLSHLNQNQFSKAKFNPMDHVRQYCHSLGPGDEILHSYNHVAPELFANVPSDRHNYIRHPNHQQEVAYFGHFPMAMEHQATNGMIIPSNSQQTFEAYTPDDEHFVATLV